MTRISHKSISGTFRQKPRFDLQSPASTAFQSSGVALVQACNAAFTSNYNTGGSLNTYAAAAPQCINTQGVQAVPTLSDVSRNLQNPKYVEWNLEVQHTFGNRVVSANYVGNRGYDQLIFNNDLNGFGFANVPAHGSPGRARQLPAEHRRIELQRNHFLHPAEQLAWIEWPCELHLLAPLDDISNGGVLPFSVITSIPSQINPFNLNANYASADYNTRHKLTASYVYQLPFKSEHRLLNAAIGGWQLSGTMFYHTGFPFSFIDSNRSESCRKQFLAGATILLQPDFSQRNFSNVASCVLNPCWGPGTANTFSPTSSFVGTVGRNAFRGPGFLGGDMSIRKDFRVYRARWVPTRSRRYNFLNHANYGTPYPNAERSVLR